MSGYNKLGSAVSAIKKKVQISQQDIEGLISSHHPFQDALFKLLAFKYNLQIESKSKKIAESGPQLSRKLLVVGNILKAIGNCLALPDPAIYLARFKHGEFYNFCSKNDEFRMLERKSLGLNPTIRAKPSNRPLFVPFIDQCKDEDIIGNPNWQISRRALTLYYNSIKDKSHKLTGSLRFSYCILLANEELLEICQQNKWNYLWANLYIFYVKSILQPYAQNKSHKWWIKPPHYYLKSIESAKSAFSGLQEVVYNLILHLLAKIREEDKDDTVQSHYEQSFLSFTNLQESKFSQMWHYYLIYSLYQQLTESESNQNIANKIKRLKNYHRQNIVTSRLAEQMHYLLPLLLQQDQIIQYVTGAHLNYWQIGLQQKTIQVISDKYFKKQKILFQVVINLSDQTFLQEIFGNNKWIEQKFAKQLLFVFDNHRQSLLQKIYRNVKIGSLIYVDEDFNQFVSLWSHYYNIINIQNSSQNHEQDKNLTEIFDFMKIVFTFQEKNFKSELGKIMYCPGQNIHASKLLIQKFIGLLEAFSKTHPFDEYEKYLVIIQQDWFSNTLGNLPTGQRDLFWEKWRYLLLADSGFVDNLLQIDMDVNLVQNIREDDFYGLLRVKSIEEQEHNSEDEFVLRSHVQQRINLSDSSIQPSS